MYDDPSQSPAGHQPPSNLIFSCVLSLLDVLYLIYNVACRADLYSTHYPRPVIACDRESGVRISMPPPQKIGIMEKIEIDMLPLGDAVAGDYGDLGRELSDRDEFGSVVHEIAVDFIGNDGEVVSEEIKMSSRSY